MCFNTMEERNMRSMINQSFPPMNFGFDEFLEDPIIKKPPTEVLPKNSELFMFCM